MPESLKDEESNTTALLLVRTRMSLSKTWSIEVEAPVLALLQTSKHKRRMR